ncbi:hypothetical protein [Nocardia sp. XZ_19_369]|uniref:hypothetical protein n=1 Tax=Nocardia sp. XZ_19_369 TaxID=2769487 RepID=UPI00188FFFF5|nr:hypothetical protein [Nocardia sp. XZ_19_369]
MNNSAAYITELFWQELKFRSTVLHAPAGQFEEFFAKIMRAAHPDSFHIARAAGRRGDLRCDGWDSETKTLYAVYAPFSIVKTSGVASKIEKDFVGARKHWPEMRRWRFVHNDFYGLSAHITRELENIRSAPEAEGVQILADWDPQSLWLIFRSLPDEERKEIIGGPVLSVALGGESFEKSSLWGHGNLPPDVQRAAVLSLAHYWGNFQPDGLLDPLTASAAAAAISAWWLDDKQLWMEYIKVLRDRSNSNPYEMQITAVAFVGRTVAICAYRAGIPKSRVYQTAKEGFKTDPIRVSVLNLVEAMYETEEFFQRLMILTSVTHL